MNSASIHEVPRLVRQLYNIVAELETLFPGRKFTPDGHLVGSIGEVVAAHRYGLILHDASVETHDAESKSGVQVQIKATQGRSVALRAQPEHLIVLKLEKFGTVNESYNGPGRLAWNACGPMQTNGQRPVSLSKLESLMAKVRPDERLPTTESYNGIGADQAAKGAKVELISSD